MAARTVLITGGSGFVGQWVTRLLLRQGDTVIAGTIDDSADPTVLTRDEHQAVRRVRLDVSSDESIARVLDRAAPERIMHLAGIAFAPDANASPMRTFEVNALGALRLLTQLLRVGARATRVLVVGSAEQYGAHPPSAQPLDESAVQTPLTVYAASKATQELIALQLSRGQGLHVVCTRSFNHAGPGQNDRFLLPSIVSRAKSLPPRGGTMTMGNGTPVRDYLHVADVATAYDALLEHGAPGQAYNVCSGTGLSVQAIVERVLRRLDVNAEVSTDRTLVRPVDVPMLVGSSAKLASATGWVPRYTLDDIIDDLIHATTR